MFNDGMIFKDKLYDSVEHSPSLVLIPIRMGLTKVSEQHLAQLKLFLKYDLCNGIMGGKHNFAVYVIGYCEDFITLDPHYCQIAGDDLSTYETSMPHLISEDQLDTTVTVSFLVNDTSQADDLMAQVEAW